MNSSRSSRKQTAEVGQLAETVVAHWLQQQNWQILERRWHCRWGELDLVALQSMPSPCLAFVEVKARSRGNWDADGLLAVTALKQKKLILAAQAFLLAHPELTEHACRFDLALVSYRQQARTAATELPIIEIGQSFAIDQYCFTLQEYIEAAFE